MSLSEDAPRLGDIKITQGGNVQAPEVLEVEYLTGYRFLAVGVAIVISMFLVRL